MQHLLYRKEKHPMPQRRTIFGITFKKITSVWFILGILLIILASS